MHKPRPSIGVGARLSGVLVCCVVLAWCAAQRPAQAQTGAQPDEASADIPAADAAPSKSAPPAGLFGTMGRWVDDYLAAVTAGAKDARERFESFGDQAAGVAKDMAKMPRATLVVGRERCESAANGAPDCRAATTTLCRAKGFQRGRSIDVSLSQKCPAQAWFSGRAPQDCRTESYVTRAACQ